MIISYNHATQPVATFVFAHGAGAGKDSDFMQWVAEGMASQGISVARFNFAYMAEQVATGKKRPPQKMPHLLEQYQARINEVDPDMPIFIGGKSMGGRAATLLLQESRAKGGICFGYPFHPPGKADKLRTEHLYALTKPLLIVQGERDTFGTQKEVEGYALGANIQTRFLADGDHSLKPRKVSGFSYPQHIQSAVDAAVNFIKAQL